MLIIFRYLSIVLLSLLLFVKSSHGEEADVGDLNAQLNMEHAVPGRKADPRDLALLNAAVTNNWDELYKAYNIGANIEARDDKVGQTALVWAAFHGHSRIVKELLKWGANIESLSLDGHKTALLFATYGGHNETVEMLLQKGAEVNAANDRGDTSISIAAYMNHTAIVDMLLHRRANINLKTKKQRYTPLHLAAFKGHYSIVQRLIDVMKSEWLADHVGEDMLHFHQASDNSEAETKTLIDSKLFDGRDREGNSPMMMAAMQGKVETCLLLLDQKSDLHMKDKKGNSAFMLAVNNGHLEMAQALLKRGALIDGANFVGQTPLMRAAYKGHAHLVRELLLQNADAKAKDQEGHDAIAYAKQAQHEKVAEILEEYFRLTTPEDELQKKKEKNKAKKTKKKVDDEDRIEL